MTTTRPPDSPRHLCAALPLVLALVACSGAPVKQAHLQPRQQRLAPDLQVTRLTERVWQHTTWHRLPKWGLFPANGLVVVGETGVVLVDATWKPSQFERLHSWVSASLRKPVVGVVVTHAHIDRIGGAAAAAKAGIPVFGLPATARLAPPRGFAPPSQALAAPRDRVTVGGVQLHTWWPGHGHAPDNLLVWLPRERILFGGCAVKSLAAKTLGYTGDADLAGWSRAIAAARGSAWKPSTVVPGHGRIGGVELLEHTAWLLDRRLPD